MRNKDGGDFTRLTADRLEPLESFAAGDAGVDQNARIRAFDERGISPTVE